MDATDQKSALEVPAHLIADAAPDAPAMPGTCSRCGTSESAPLMRANGVEYRLCGACGRVWVERCGRAAATVPAAVLTRRDGISARLLAALVAAARFINALQA